MRGRAPSLAVPPAARARALGALVPVGSHAVAYASADPDGVLAGFVLEGLQAGERVIVLSDSPRSAMGRLRAQGVGAPSARPGALRVQDLRRLAVPFPEFAGRQAAEAVHAGFEGARVARLCARPEVEEALGSEARLPARFNVPLTVLCLYTEAALRGVSHQAAWAAARHHARIVLL